MNVAMLSLYALVFCGILDKYPFIFHYTIPTNTRSSTSVIHKLRQMNVASMKNSEEKLKHEVKMYEECVTLGGLNLDIANKHPMTENSGYIIGVFRVPYGDDNEMFERNWMVWSGK